MRAPAVQKSSFDGWNTPPSIVALLRSFGLDGVSLDPCSNASSGVGAALSRGKEHDGLSEDWRALLAGINREGGLVYVNPPYDSPTLLRVVKHCAQQASQGVEIIALVPAKVDQGWWQDWVIPYASALCFLRGRIKFWREGAPWQGASSPCILLYWGRDSQAFVEHFAGVGRCLDLALVPAEDSED